MMLRSEFKALSSRVRNSSGNFLKRAVHHSYIHPIFTSFFAGRRRQAAHSPVLSQSQKWIQSLTWSLIASAGVGVAWLGIARTEEVVVVQGQLEPIGDVKQIQLPIGGVVERILVNNGQTVSKGDVLIQLDTEASSQQLASIQSRIRDKQLQILRTKELHVEQYNSLLAQLALDETILKRLESLRDSGATSELQLLQQLTVVQKIKGELSSSTIESKRQLTILRQELAQLQAEDAIASTSLAYQSLRSPVDGVVFDLKPTSPGFVAQTSEPVLKIVPPSMLEADVEVPSDKIGFVRTGMSVDISIDSFPSTDFGVIHGEVISIGSDALPPDQQKQQTKYNFPATIKLQGQTLVLSDGRHLPLQVGMSLTANIKLRSVSYLQLLFSTFQRKTDSLRSI